MWLVVHLSALQVSGCRCRLVHLRIIYKFPAACMMVPLKFKLLYKITLSVTDNYCRLFVRAIEKLLSDDGFKLPSALAKEAYCRAEQLLHWSAQLNPPHNGAALASFSSDLVAKLKLCIPITTPASASREVLWRNYHQYRCSQDFHTKWKIFLQSAIHSESTPIFYQYITEKVFEDLLKESFPLPVTSQAEDANLTYEERNAL